jgi:acylphosphatase
MERRGYRITGHVQGIGYRYFANRRAQELNLRGWVCNREDGSVEVQVEGAADQLHAFESLLREGPSSGRVTDLERIEANKGEAYPDFEIRFG